ncbi:MAG: hypothetical protein JSR39_02660 [Verrucomicrobia bacterium]|nr:hypothetical protein [Verrucomicrobiota bacterium]
MAVQPVINKAYIENLPYAQENKLKPVAGQRFFAALEATYGEDKVASTTRFLYKQPDQSFHGVKEFKDRMTAALVDNAPLSVDDQKYLANIAQNIALGVFKE